MSDYTIAQLVMNMPLERAEFHDGAWIQKPIAAEFEKRGGWEHMPDADWRELLVDDGVIRWRRRWVEGTPFDAGIRIARWLPRAKVTLTAVDPELGTIESRSFGPGSCFTEPDVGDRSFAKQPLPNTDHVALGVLIEQLPFGSDSSGVNGVELIERWRGRIVLPVASMRDFDHVMQSDSSDATTRALRSSITAEVHTQVVLLELAWNDEQRSELSSLAFSASVELLRHGQVMSRGKLFASERDPGANRHDFQGHVFFAGALPDLAPGADLTAWEARVIGTSEGVLEAWSADRWWSGTFTAPLAELMRSR